MDAFEILTADILWRLGYWVRTSVFVNLTKAEKVRIGRPSTPRWALDIVAYRAADNTLLVVECKSYMDSPGVRYASFSNSSDIHSSRFKLFNEPDTWVVVRDRLIAELCERGTCAPAPNVRLALACGNIRSDHDRSKILEHFQGRGWELFDDAWVRANLKAMADEGYDNNPAVMAAKLLLRQPKRGRSAPAS